MANRRAITSDFRNRVLACVRKAQCRDIAKWGVNYPVYVSWCYKNGIDPKAITWPKRSKNGFFIIGSVLQFDRDYCRVLGIGDTQGEAWEDAWRTILANMLERLER